MGADDSHSVRRSSIVLFVDYGKDVDKRSKLSRILEEFGRKTGTAYWKTSCSANQYMKTRRAISWLEESDNLTEWQGRLEQAETTDYHI